MARYNVISGYSNLLFNTAIYKVVSKTILFCYIFKIKVFSKLNTIDISLVSCIKFFQTEHPNLIYSIPLVPITFLYGSESWIARHAAQEDDQEIPGASIPHSTVEMIEGAGHHVYADMPDLFNSAVRTALK